MNKAAHMDQASKEAVTIAAKSKLCADAGVMQRRCQPRIPRDVQPEPRIPENLREVNAGVIRNAKQRETPDISVRHAVGLLNLPSSAAIAIRSCLQLPLSPSSLSCEPSADAPGLVSARLTPLMPRPLTSPPGVGDESELMSAPIVGKTFCELVGRVPLGVVPPDRGPGGGVRFFALNEGRDADVSVDVPTGGAGDGRCAGRVCAGIWGREPGGYAEP